MKTTPHFERLWKYRDEFEALCRAPNSTYALSRDWKLAFVNEAWERFALENGASDEFLTEWTVGVSVLETLLRSPSGRRALENFEAVFATRSARSFSYECSSPENFRQLHANCTPLGSGEEMVCVVTNATLIELPHDRPIESFVAERYLNDALITQCSECRRIEDADGGRWDWVPELLESNQFAVSHELCPICLEYWTRGDPSPTAK